MAVIELCFTDFMANEIVNGSWGPQMACQWSGRKKPGRQAERMECTGAVESACREDEIKLGQISTAFEQAPTKKYRSERKGHKTGGPRYQLEGCLRPMFTVLNY
jgi:hypothetical protein